MKSNKISIETTQKEKDRERKKTIREKNEDLLNKELLKLIGCGSTIICEILHLKDFIPEPYSNKNVAKLYKDILFDFSIFKSKSTLLDDIFDKLMTVFL